jgi:CO/xanthine dehydrogenase FAD-binding subunit
VREQEKITDARIALTGVGDKPWRELRVEQMVVGQKASTDLFGKIGVEIAARINPASDIHASESYRRSLARVLNSASVDGCLGQSAELAATNFVSLDGRGMR